MKYRIESGWRIEGQSNDGKYIFRYRLRKIVGYKEFVLHRGSDFCPGPAIRVRLTLECGHGRWFPASRCPREKTHCYVCNWSTNSIYSHPDIRDLMGRGIKMRKRRK